MMEVFRLTDPDGGMVWVYPAWVQMVRKPLSGEIPTNGTVKAVVILSGLNLHVRETVDEVIGLLRRTE